MTDLTGTDVATLLDGAYANVSGVAVLRDSATGGVAILLTAAAAGDLGVYFADLGLSHDLITDGYNPDGVDVIMAIRHAF